MNVPSGTAVRLEPKHFGRHVVTRARLGPGEGEGRPGEIHGGENVTTPER